MTATNEKADAIMSVLTPELKKLAENAPPYGELILRAKVANFQIGTISLGIETARRVTARPALKGGEV
ncbi:hypothetical protein FACS1894109_20810 [Spirochaetia bacterium]|nr:hypothetical protein FACS1894109_20810 [Spirochaetia bacterium]